MCSWPTKWMTSCLCCNKRPRRSRKKKRECRRSVPTGCDRYSTNVIASITVSVWITDEGGVVDGDMVDHAETVLLVVPGPVPGVHFRQTQKRGWPTTGQP